VPRRVCVHDTLTAAVMGAGESGFYRARQRGRTPRLFLLAATMAWTAALRACRRDMGELDILTALLASYAPGAPPPVAPPEMVVNSQLVGDSGAADRQPPHSGPSAAATRAMLNRFAMLDVGGGGPAAHESEGANEDTLQAGTAVPSPSAAEEQCRYLLLQAQCLRSEEFRRLSESVGRSGTPVRWTESAELLRAAYSLLEQAMGSDEHMEWWVLLSQVEDGQLQPSALPDGHDFDALTRLRDAVNVEQTTLGQMKVRAIKAADRRMELVESKLNPMQEERTVVRASMGEWRWTHNPAPKLTYAERIALLKAEMEDLQMAMLLLSSLQFSAAARVVTHRPARRGARRGRQ
jgi:hypothetical protein